MGVECLQRPVSREFTMCKESSIRQIDDFSSEAWKPEGNGTTNSEGSSDQELSLSLRLVFPGNDFVCSFDYPSHTVFSVAVMNGYIYGFV